MMYVERTDFPLAGGPVSQAIRDSDVSPSHSLKVGSVKIHAQVPGIQRCCRDAKSSDRPLLLMKSCSISLRSLDNWLSLSAIPSVGSGCE